MLPRAGGPEQVPQSGASGETREKLGPLVGLC